MTLSTPITGTGDVEQAGTGTTILTGDNLYSGGTTISAGTLQLGNGSGSGSVVGDIVDNSHLVVNRGGIYDVYTYNDVISGSGDLTKRGNGRLILSNDNTYTGGTTVSGGTLQIGNGATTGSVVGDILDNSSVAFDHSNTFTEAGLISGTGSLAQLGGTTILTADNTYSAGTLINAGATLQAGNGGTTGTIGSGAVFNSGALIFDRSDTYTQSAGIGGGGTVEQAGTGTLIFDSNQP